MCRPFTTSVSFGVPPVRLNLLPVSYTHLQTVMGKAPIGVAEIAKKYGKPVLAFSGCVAEDAGVCNEYGIDAFFSILCNAGTIAEVSECEQATWNMTTTVEQIFRLIKTLKH